MIELVEAEEPEGAILENEALTLTGRVNGCAITSKEEAANAAELLQNVKGMAKQITEFFAPMKQKAHSAWKAITAGESAQLAPLLDAEAKLKARLSTWLAAEELRVRQEESRRAEEARQRAEEMALLEAIDLEAAGEKDAAAVVLAEPVLAPVVRLDAPKVAGVSSRETWEAVVVDLKALCTAVAAGTVPLEFVTPNQKALDALARSLKGGLNFPGVKVQSRRVLASGSGR